MIKLHCLLFYLLINPATIVFVPGIAERSHHYQPCLVPKLVQNTFMASSVLMTHALNFQKS